MRNRLLLVDGDPRSLRVLDVSLRNAGFEVDTAINGTDAWTMLESAAPDLIIADTDLGGIDGFELCTRVRQSPLGAKTPFILLAADKTLEQKIRALEAGANDYLVKPAYFKEVLAHVRALLQRRDRERLVLGQDIRQDPQQDPRQDPKRDPKLGASPHDGPVEPAGLAGLGDGLGPDGRVVRERFAGSITDITVVDLLQLIEGNGRSGIVHLRAPNGAPASIYFRHGKVVDAEVGRLSGIDALSRLFSWQDGGFEVEWKSIRRKDAIERLSAELVIEGMQRLDEWNQLREQLPDPNAVFEVDYRLLAERLAEIPDEVNGILRLCDGVRTIMQVVEDSAIPDNEALTAMIRLREEGIVYEASGVQAHERSPDSTRLGGWLGSGSSPLAAPPASHTPTGRMGIGSGPVQQSFADRLQVEAQAEGQAEGDDGPGDGPGNDGPGEGPGDVSPTSVRSAGADAEREAGPRPRRTALGLGESTTEVSAVAQAIPEARPGQVEDNVIKFPAPGVPRTGGSGATRLAAAMPDPEEPVSAHASSESAAPAAPAAAGPSRPHPSVGSTPPVEVEGETGAEDSPLRADPPLPVAPAPPSVPAALKQTHRGVGPMPPELDANGETGVPAAVPDRVSGRVRQSGSMMSGVVASSGSRAEGSSKPAPVTVAVADRESVPVAPLEAAPPAERSGARMLMDQAADHTVRVSFPDNEISRGDALDELGLPSRWRGFRFLVGAFVLGTLAAVGLNRFLSNSGKVDGAAHGPIAVQKAGAPDGVGRANPPPEVVAPRGPVVIPSTASAPAVDLPGNPAVAATAAKPAVPGGAGKATPIVDPPPGVAPPGVAPPGAASTAAAAARPSAVDLPKPSSGAAPVKAGPSSGAPGVSEIPVRPVAAAEAARGAASPGDAAAEAARGAVPPAHAAAEAARGSAPARTGVEPPRAPGAPGRAAADPAPAVVTDAARQLADCRSTFARDRLREAFAACTAAVAANPNSAEALAMLAHTELNRGRMTRANELAQKAVTIDPNLADAYVIIGGVHQDSGQNRDAKAAYRRYLQLAPRGRYADELRSIVNGL